MIEPLVQKLVCPLVEPLTGGYVGKLDGNNDYGTWSGVLPATDLTLENGYIVEAWADLDVSSGSSIIFSHRNSSLPLMQLVLTAGTGAIIQFRTSTSALQTATATLSDTFMLESHFYTAIFDFANQELLIFVDNVLRDRQSIVTTGTLTSAKTLVGGFNSGASDIARYDGVLYGMRVLEIDGTVLADCPIDEGTGTTSSDISGNSNDISWNSITPADFWVIENRMDEC